MHTEMVGSGNEYFVSKFLQPAFDSFRDMNSLIEENFSKVDILKLEGELFDAIEMALQFASKEACDPELVQRIETVRPKLEELKQKKTTWEKTQEIVSFAGSVLAILSLLFPSDQPQKIIDQNDILISQNYEILEQLETQNEENETLYDCIQSLESLICELNQSVQSINNAVKELADRTEQDNDPAEEKPVVEESGQLYSSQETQ